MKRRVVLSVIFLVTGVLVYYIFDCGILKKDTCLLLRLTRDYLPDLLWGMSFFFASIWFSKRIVKHYLLLNSLYVFMIGTLYETLQLFDLVKGTFDVCDILIIAVSVLLSCLLECKIRRFDAYEKNT